MLAGLGPRPFARGSSLDWPFVDRGEWGDDEAEPVRPPLPPEDRLWRHPSELGNGGEAAAPAALPPPPPSRRSRRPVMVVAAVAGVLILGATGASIRAMTDTSPEGAARSTTTAPLSIVKTSTEAAPKGGAIGRVSVIAQLASGDRTSGGVVFDQTTIVTTIAAVTGATALFVSLADGRRVLASLLGTDRNAGLAVLGVERTALAPADTHSAVGLRDGDELWMDGVGEPAHIAALGRHTKSADGSNLHHVMRLEDTGRWAHEGASLVDDDGEVVGLCTRDMKGDVIGIPIDLANSAARSLRANHKLVLPLIGVTGSDADADATENLPHGGALLATVSPNGPAGQAGLRPKDVVVAINGIPVASISELVLAARAYDPGQAVPISLVRDGQPLQLTLTLGSLTAS